MKKIWFVSPYSMPPQYEMRIKTQMYSQILQSKGHETLIFSSSILHNLNVDLMQSIKKQYIEKEYDGNTFIHIKTRKYTGNGIKRIFNMMQFSLKFVRIAQKFSKPDVIIADVNCINYGPIYKYSKKNSIKFIIDMRDLWPMSIVEYYKYSEKNLFIKYLYLREKKMYMRADAIVFSMPGYEEYLNDRNLQKKVSLSKCFYINNGVDLEEFQNNTTINTYNNSLYNKNVFKVVYTGSIREANNLKVMMEAFSIIKKSQANIELFLFGTGDQIDYLKQYCQKNSIDNVHFMGFVEKKFIPSILTNSNLNVLVYKNAKTLKYGGSQNKLFEYIAANVPVLVTVNMKYSIVTNKIGVMLESTNPQNISEGILKVYQQSLQNQYDKSDFQSIIKEFDFKILTNKLENIISQICK